MILQDRKSKKAFWVLNHVMETVGEEAERRRRGAKDPVAPRRRIFMLSDVTTILLAVAISKYTRKSWDVIQGRFVDLGYNVAVS